MRGLKQKNRVLLTDYLKSHPARGAWIETKEKTGSKAPDGRTPPGVRGLKLFLVLAVIANNCRTPPGVRGLKLYLSHQNHIQASRTPPGVRGLKLLSKQVARKEDASHPARGAWIETATSCKSSSPVVVAPRPGCVD